MYGCYRAGSMHCQYSRSSLGRARANTHAPDEYVAINSFIDAAKVLLAFTVDWCSIPHSDADSSGSLL